MHDQTNELSSLVTQCDKEPIHLLGRIQNHGFMIIVDKAGVVTHFSENLDSFANVPGDKLLGDTLWDLLDRKLVHAIRGVQSQAMILGKAAYLHSVSIPHCKDTFDLCIHQSAEHLVLEFEKLESSGKYEGVITALMAQIWMFPELEDLYQGLVESVRTATGHDRVMLYQFLADGSGEVVAESTTSDMAPFLGLRYPASDIPRQARLLYKKNLIRTITDVNGETHRIIGKDSEDTSPVDWHPNRSTHLRRIGST